MKKWHQFIIVIESVIKEQVDLEYKILVDLNLDINL